MFCGVRYQPGMMVRLVLAVALLCPLLAHFPAVNPARAAEQGGGLRVVGDQLVDGAGRPVRLLGMNRAGTEYACVQGWGIFDGPHDARSVDAMLAWGINAVRVPLNEHCWFGIGGVPEAYGGEKYRAAIVEWVATLRAAGLYVILDLHWSAPDGDRADRLQPMPDRDYAPRFWQQVAETFGGDGAILFDLFNEPYPDLNGDTEEAWRCWRDGGDCAWIPYPVAGMQELIDAVRGTGATNVILVAGVQYANSFSRFRAYAPQDPLGNLAVSWHIYNFMITADEPGWDALIGIPTAGVPLVTTELGQDDCRGAFLQRALDWLDARGASYLGWTWNAWGRCDGSVLIEDYDGTPTATGQVLRDHLALVGPATLATRGVGGGTALPPVAGDGSAGSVPVPGTLVLYDDVVPSPFLAAPFGLNGQDPCERAVRASGRCAYALAFSSWGGLGIGRADGFSTAGYERLVWAFNPHGQPLADFSIALTALDGNQTIRAVPLDRARVEADLGEGWVRLSVSVGALNPANATVREVVLRNASGQTLGVVHLDDVWLVPGGIGAGFPAGAWAAR